MNIYITLLVPYAIVAATATRLGLTAQQVTDITAFLAAWNPVYSAYLAPGTHGDFTTAQVNALYKTYKLYFDGLKQQLKNNPALTLTEMDYIMFDIHKNATPRLRIPAPFQRAMIALRLTNHLNNEYRVSDEANPTKAVKPADVKRIKVFMLILLATAPPPTIDMLVEEMTVGSMNFDIPFTDDQVGMIAYIAVCFSNDSGDGTKSPIIACPII